MFVLYASLRIVLFKLRIENGNISSQNTKYEDIFLETFYQRCISRHGVALESMVFDLYI